MCRGKRSWVMLKGVKFCPTPAVCGLLLLCVLWGRGGWTGCAAAMDLAGVWPTAARSRGPVVKHLHLHLRTGGTRYQHRDDGSLGRSLDGNLGMMMRSHLTSVSSGALHGRAMIAPGWNGRWDMQWLIAHRSRDAWLCEIRDDAKSKVGSSRGGVYTLGLVEILRFPYLVELDSSRRTLRVYTVLAARSLATLRSGTIVEMDAR
jgi:hypothetical protein